MTDNKPEIYTEYKQEKPKIYTDYSKPLQPDITEQELVEKTVCLLEEKEFGEWDIGKNSLNELIDWVNSLPKQILAIYKEALPELAKEAGYKSPAEIMEMFKGYEDTIKLLREQLAHARDGYTEPEFREKMWQILHNHKKEEEWSIVVVNISDLIKEAGYFQEEAEWIGKLLQEGWIPPAEAKNYVKLAEDQSFPGFLTLGECSMEEFLQAMRNADYKAGWRKVEL